MATTTILNDIPSTGKHVQFDRKTKDYSVFVNGEYVGSRPTEQDAYNLACEVAYDIERGMYIASEAAESLDIARAVDTIRANREIPLSEISELEQIEQLLGLSEANLSDVSYEKVLLLVRGSVCGAINVLSAAENDLDELDLDHFTHIGWSLYGVVRTLEQLILGDIDRYLARERDSLTLALRAMARTHNA